MSSYRANSEEQTKNFGTAFAKTLNLGDVVFLNGDLGSGKTTLVKGIASYFGINQSEVTSPTFSLLNCYGKGLVHFDLYRLESPEQFINAGLGEYISDDYIAIVEWPNLIRPLLGKAPIDLYIEYLGENQREITCESKLKIVNF